jgi:hypothetical protein
MAGSRQIGPVRGFGQNFYIFTTCINRKVMNNLKFISAIFILMMTGSIAVVAQKNVDKPTQEQLDAWKKAEEEQLHNDWANFARFREII